MSAKRVWWDRSNWYVHFVIGSFGLFSPLHARTPKSFATKTGQYLLIGSPSFLNIGFSSVVVTPKPNKIPTNVEIWIAVRRRFISCCCNSTCTLTRLLLLRVRHCWIAKYVTIFNNLLVTSTVVNRIHGGMEMDSLNMTSNAQSTQASAVLSVLLRRRRYKINDERNRKG